MQLIQPRLNPGIKKFSWGQGSRFKVEMWNQAAENIPRYDPVKCLSEMFVCPVLKVSHVMMKCCRRTSHLGRFTLWNNGRRATQLGRFTLWHYGRLATQLSRFTLWHNRRWASQLAGKFTLWHNGRRAKQPGLMHAPGVARIFQRKIWRLNPK